MTDHRHRTGIRPIEYLRREKQQNERNDLLLGKISTVESPAGSRAGAPKLVVLDELWGLLYRLDHTDVGQAGLSQ